MSYPDNNQNSQKNNDAADFSTTDYAVALQYDKDAHNAPVVSAKGQGQIAAKIIELALENNIEIRQDADLVQMLKAQQVHSLRQTANLTMVFQKLVLSLFQ